MWKNFVHRLRGPWPPVPPGFATVDQISIPACGSVVSSPVRSGAKPQPATTWCIPKRLHYFGVTWIASIKILYSHAWWSKYNQPLRTVTRFKRGVSECVALLLNILCQVPSRSQPKPWSNGGLGSTFWGGGPSWRSWHGIEFKSEKEWSKPESRAWSTRELRAYSSNRERSPIETLEGVGEMVSNLERQR